MPREVRQWLVFNVTDKGNTFTGDTKITPDCVNRHAPESEVDYISGEALLENDITAKEKKN